MGIKSLFGFGQARDKPVDKRPGSTTIFVSVWKDNERKACQ